MLRASVTMMKFIYKELAKDKRKIIAENEFLHFQVELSSCAKVAAACGNLAAAAAVKRCKKLRFHLCTNVPLIPQLTDANETEHTVWTRKFFRTNIN